MLSGPLWAAQTTGYTPPALQRQRGDKRAEHTCLSRLGLHQVQHVCLQWLGVECRREKAGVRLERREKHLVRQKAGIQSLRSKLLILPTAMKPALTGMSVELLESPGRLQTAQVAGTPERDQRRRCPFWQCICFLLQSALVF